jgi:hypothetical protein
MPMLAPPTLTVSFLAPSGLLRGRPGPRESRIEAAPVPGTWEERTSVSPPG